MADNIIQGDPPDVDPDSLRVASMWEQMTGTKMPENINVKEVLKETQYYNDTPEPKVEPNPEPTPEPVVDTNNAAQTKSSKKKYRIDDAYQGEAAIKMVEEAEQDGANPPRSAASRKRDPTRSNDGQQIIKKRRKKSNSRQRSN